jgi:hypothetical protein
MLRDSALPETPVFANMSRPCAVTVAATGGFAIISTLET